MKKKLCKPALASVTIEQVAKYLNTDPEIADFYCKRFYLDHGEKAYLSMIDFLKWALENGKEEVISPTLEINFSTPATINRGKT